MNNLKSRAKPERPPFALVLEIDGFGFLIDTRDLYRPPRVLVRRGYCEGEVWLDEDDLSFIRSKFSDRDEKLILSIAHEHIDELLDSWVSLKDDAHRDRLERNELVY